MADRVTEMDTKVIEPVLPGAASISELASKRRHWLVRGISIAALLLAALVTSYFVFRAQAPAYTYVTAPVSYGDVTQTLSANGTLNPVVVVNVGSQVSGTVQKLYVDFNSRVHRGQTLLELDPTLFKAQVAQSEAALHNAQAGMLLSKANAERARTLRMNGSISQADLDQVVASLASAQSQVELATAQLQRDRANLNYSIIRSPVDGVVIDRQIDTGQTVAASFQTPTLFKIGQNLGNMQIDVTVDEADVGQVKVGQLAAFTVDAYPDAKFSGTVVQIRLNPTIIQNVVTYDVVIGVDNRDGRLLPGMTAYVNISVNQRHHVLVVPNTALRVRVPEAQLAVASTAQQSAASAVYVLVDGKLSRVPVKIGASDGQMTEILGATLEEGQSVVTAMASASQAKRRNPFQLF